MDAYEDTDTRSRSLANEYINKTNRK